ncbi:hypothetical protein GPECTOR_12g399 [Gonium pectorale]|uniref:Uncharacterized protein n=1 Tax=Gonium pectorale TaxID=33097 RepID=A0A150GNP6_GONPE|nr:hypothetical protein GPECTOR_12g399 [Gonium pectorale]|eukprot:KXZ51437.1 hypothetical protein GPECTOR_12g399 [Gonium pectorale]
MVDGSQSTGASQNPQNGLVRDAGGAAAAAPAYGFNASQRALLGAARTQLRLRAGDLSSGDCSSGSGALDDASALDLEPSQPLLQVQPRALSASVATGVSGRRVPGRADTSDDQLIGLRLGRGHSTDTGQTGRGRDQGVTRSARASARQLAPSLASTATASAGTPASYDDSDEDISLEGLDVLSPAASHGPSSGPVSGAMGGVRTVSGTALGAGAVFSGFACTEEPGDTGADARAVSPMLLSPAPPRLALGRLEVVPGTPDGAMQGKSSPTWEELDDMMARGMAALEVTPPSLPRLRIPSRFAPEVPAAPAAAAPAAAAPRALLPPRAPLPPQAAAAAASTAAGGSSGRGVVCDAVTRVQTEHEGAGFDPDHPSNYDGDDPSAADTFFSSPFFDENMLEEAGSEFGSDAGSDDEEEDVVEEPEPPHQAVAAPAGGRADESAGAGDSEGEPAPPPAPVVNRLQQPAAGHQVVGRVVAGLRRPARNRA